MGKSADTRGKQAQVQAKTSMDDNSQQANASDSALGGWTSRSGRPAYYPSTVEWILVALTIGFAGTGASFMVDGQKGTGLLVLAAAVVFAVGALFVHLKRKGR